MAQQKEHTQLLIRILVAINIGIFTGLFFGEYCSILRPIGDIYVMLLQSVVYPYLIASLVGGFGRMDSGQTLKLFKKGWGIYLLLILVTFFVLFVLLAGIPKAQSHIIAPEGQIGFWTQIQQSLQLFIPSNPFQALVNNAIPAIVLFSILYGLALQRIKNKESTLVFCEIISRASLQIWNWVIKIAPIGIFALIAYTFGTIAFSQIAGLATYTLLFFFGSLFLTFVFLPLILHILIPISYREVLTSLQSALLISLATTLSVTAIPFIAKTTHDLLKRQSINTPESDEIINNSLSISYPLCQIGNCFGFLFIVVAVAYFHQSLGFSQTILLAFASYFSSIGSPSATVNSISFLIDWTHLPQTGVDLYVLLMPFTRYAQVLVSVMGMAFFTIAISFAYFNKLKLNIKALGLTLCVAAFIVIGSVLFGPSLQHLSGNLAPNLLKFQLSSELKQGVKVSFPSLPSSQSSSLVLSEIRQRGVLRVGFDPHMIPWCYYNGAKELVGYDVAFMYQLAKDIQVDLEFIPFQWENLVDQMQKGFFDIAIGSIYVTSERLQQVGFTDSYDSTTSALIVHNDVASHFDRLENILKLNHLQIASFNDPITLSIAKLNFPPEDIVTVENYENVFENKQIQAALWTKGHTDAWVSIHNGYTSISPKGLIQGWPQMLAYMVNKDAVDFQNFLNDWLKLKQIEGFTAEQQNKWILRIPPQMKVPRWSIMRNIWGLN